MREDCGPRLSPRPVSLRRRERGSARAVASAALAAIVLAGCAGTDAGRPAGTGRTDASYALPTTERLADDLYMVPVSRDGRGCVQYRMESEKRPRLQAVFYRTRAGDFSTIEAEAACT